MNLSTFKTIEEKSSAYEYTQVYSFADLLFYLQTISNNNPQNTYFRGQPDGSWKLYSSMQREWLTRELGYRYSSYSEIILKFLAYAKEYNLIQLRNLCKAITDTSIFSVLQHYGAPTPFIDWTLDYKVALFFATHKSNEMCLGNETNSYVSLYWFNGGNGAQTPNDDLTDLGQTRAEFQEVQNESGTDPEVILEVLGQTSYHSKWGDLLWIITNKNPDFVDVGNLRQTLQDGAFVYTKEHGKSLDEIFTGTMIKDDESEGGTLQCDEPQTPIFKPTGMPDNVVNTPKAAPLCLPKIHCLDIHKSIVPQIKKFLQDRNITKENLGLNTDDWGQKAFQSFLEEYSLEIKSNPIVDSLKEIPDLIDDFMNDFKSP